VLFGTTDSGGNVNAGTVYKMLPSGYEVVLHSFGGEGDGFNPYSSLVKVKSKLYGTTQSGGANEGGTVFVITQSGAEKVLHSFAGGSNDGVNPGFNALLDVKGTLYGMTEFGGPENDGTVFKITTSGKEKLLYSFVGGFDGANPSGALVYVNGKLYGTTGEGGTENCGTLFSIAKSGKKKVLYNFGGAPDGCYPNGVINAAGTFYGMTYSGGASNYGTVFSITI
jgi:uncharacterized repeat protein (TIGR03803 family)